MKNGEMCLFLDGLTTSEIHKEDDRVFRAIATRSTWKNDVVHESKWSLFGGAKRKLEQEE